MKIKSYFLFIFFTLTLITKGHAQFGPYKKRQGKANTAQRVIHLLDNMTVGSIQTTLGAAHILVYAISDEVQDNNDEMFRVHQHKKSEVTQININRRPPFWDGAYSLGLFAISPTKGHDKHEGGHSVASAALGPLYLPTVALDYLFELSTRDNIIEDWAELEASPDSYLSTAQIQVGAGSMKLGDERRQYLVFKFSLDQNQVSTQRSVEVRKSYRWLKSNIMLPLVMNNRQELETLPPYIEIDLLHKSIDFSTRDPYSYYSDQRTNDLNFIIRTDQKYGHLENSPLLKAWHIKALEWKAKYGMSYNFGNIVTALVSVGPSASADIFAGSDLSDSDSPRIKNGFNLSAGYAINTELRFFNYLSLFNEFDQSFYLGGNTHRVNSTGVKNEFRHIYTDFGTLHYLEFAAEAKFENWKIRQQDHDTSRFELSLGLRF